MEEDEKKEVAVIEDINRPLEVANFGRNAAAVLKDIVKQADLIKNINGNDYMMFEGWQTVGKFFKTNAGIEWTKPIKEDNGEIEGFEARAYVQDEDGKIISTAESYCGRDEPNWKSRPIFAIRSMAQTRACAKALRQVYSWVVVLAGYKPTPADEMSDIGKPIESKVVQEKKIKIPKDPVCSKCKVKINEKVYKYSVEHGGKSLCYSCQKGKTVDAEYTEEAVM